MAERLELVSGGSSAHDHALFDRLPVPAYIFDDEDLRFRDVNAAASSRYGYTRDELLRLSLLDLIPEEDRAEAQSLAMTRAEDERFQASLRHRAKSGEIVHVEVVSQPVLYHGRPSRYVVVTELTARREAEKKLHDLNVQLRHMSARTRARREEDRTRLSRELHDQLGQALAGLKIDLFWLRDRIAGSPDLDNVSEKIGAMIGLVDDTILRVRRLSSELRPPVLDRLGLVAAIEWQLEEFQRRTEIETTLNADAEQVPLDLGRSTAVFRIFQEVLTNVATHAHATRVDVRLSIRDGSLVLSVADNGAGISRETLESSQSLGLVGMHERADLLDGSVTIRPAEPRGTIVTLTIPLGDRRRTVREAW